MWSVLLISSQQPIYIFQKNHLNLLHILWGKDKNKDLGQKGTFFSDTMEIGDLIFQT